MRKYVILPVERFNTFEAMSPAEMQRINVVDEVRSGEAWRTFATAVYRRKGT